MKSFLVVAFSSLFTFPLVSLALLAFFSTLSNFRLSWNDTPIACKVCIVLGSERPSLMAALSKDETIVLWLVASAI